MDRRAFLLTPLGLVALGTNAKPTSLLRSMDLRERIAEEEAAWRTRTLLEESPPVGYDPLNFIALWDEPVFSIARRRGHYIVVTMDHIYQIDGCEGHPVVQRFNRFTRIYFEKVEEWCRVQVIHQS